MYRAGELPGFRLGKLIRIPASEVERYECKNIDSSSTASDSASPTPMASADGYASRLVRQTVVSQKLALVKSGEQDTDRQASG